MYKNQSEYGTENEPAAPQTTLTSNKPKSQLEQDDDDLTSLLG
jgi:hypothetical protein